METQPRALQTTIYDCFSLIDDPRAANAAHPLVTVLFCLIVGVVCGADGFVQAEHIARLKKSFIRKYVPIKRDVPTHDTMARVLADLDPDQFVSAFAALMERVSGRPAKDIINLDGKTLRGVVGVAAMKRADGAESQAHIVSAFSSLRGIVLGQLRSECVANEVVAAQELLQILDVRGAVVTVDAAHTCRRTLEIIEERGADVVVAVKANAAKLQEHIVEAFEREKPQTIRTAEKARGTIEGRTYEIIAASREDVSADDRFGFPTLNTFIRVTRENVSHAAVQQRTERETFYASSLKLADAERIAECIRARWAIENKLHYVLDITFSEDRSRIRTKNAPENFARIRHIALGLLALQKSPKLSFPLKRTTAAMDDRYLTRALRLPPVTTEMR